LIVRSSSPITQLLAAFGCFDATAACSKYSASSADCVSTPASYSGNPYAATNRGGSRSGSSGIVARDGGDARLVQHERRQIRLGEVAVVVRFLFAAHRDGAARAGVPQPRLLDDASAAVDEVGPAGEISYSSAFSRYRNELRFLTSALVPNCRCPVGAHRHVRVAPKTALLHVAVVDASQTRRARSRSKNSTASAGERMSGSLTISMSGRRCG
jgi:hypothetical protein